MAIVIEETDSGENHYVLRDIEQRLQEIVWILWAGWEISEELRSQAGSILQAHQQSAQTYMHWVEEPLPPDFHPFVSVPPGTTVKDLPDGGRLFPLADGAFMQVSPDTKFQAIEMDGDTYSIEPVGRKVTMRDGREFLLKEGLDVSSHEDAGIEGLPEGVEAVVVSPGSYRVELPDGTRLDINHADGTLVITTKIGTVLLIGASKIQGIGEPVDVRLLSGGAKSFAARQCGHRGVVEGDGTVHLALRGGLDLVIRFPEGQDGDGGDGDGQNGDGGPCGLVCEKRD